MGQIQIDVDLFCAACSNALQIESSKGHHVLVEPCVHCMQVKVEQTVEKVKDEENKDDRKEANREKLEQWRKDQEKRDEELENITGSGATAVKEGAGYDE